MRPLHSRNDLLALVAQHASTKACERAVYEDRATVLGGFTPADRLPSYIVHVDGRYGQSWVIRVECDEVNRRYLITRISEDEIPWASWAGQSTGKRPLIDGDQPLTSSFKRMRSRYDSRSTKTSAAR